MSDGAAGASPAAAPAVAPPSSGGGSNDGMGKQSGFVGGFPGLPVQGLPGANTGSEPKSEAPSDGLEEVALGSVKTRVTKEVAKALKDYERGVQKKFEQTAQLRKQAEQTQRLLELFDKNPDEFARVKGIDLDKFAEQRLAKKYELMTASPEQRQLMEARMQLEQYQQRELTQKAPVIDQIKQLLGKDAPPDLEKYPVQELAQYLNFQKQQYQAQQQNLDRDFGEAWKQSGLPKHKYFGALMAFQMINHEKSTGEPLQAGDAAAKVKSDFLKNVREIASQMDPQGIQELLGKDVLEKIRQYDIERVTGKPASQMKSGPGSPASPEPKKYLNELEWRAAMGIR